MKSCLTPTISQNDECTAIILPISDSHFIDYLRSLFAGEVKSSTFTPETNLLALEFDFYHLWRQRHWNPFTSINAEVLLRVADRVASLRWFNSSTNLCWSSLFGGGTFSSGRCAEVVFFWFRSLKLLTLIGLTFLRWSACLFPSGFQRKRSMIRRLIKFKRLSHFYSISTTWSNNRIRDSDADDLYTSLVM